MLVHSPIFQGQLIERILSLTFLVLMLGGFEKNAKSRSEKCWKNVGKMLEKCKKRQDKFSTVVDTNKSRVQFHL